MRKLKFSRVVFIAFLIVAVSLIYAPSLVAEEGGTLRIANPADITKLDPIEIQDAPTSRVANMIFDHLATLDRDGMLKPELAKSWDVAEDAKTYTFYLREDVTFQDGAKFNAEAVKFHFERLMDPDWASPMRGEFVDVIESIEVPDEYTIRFNLSRPDVTFIDHYMIHNGTFIVSPDAVEKYGEDFGLNPVGTGPFVFEEYREAEFVRLSRNENYWAGAPKLDAVVFRPIPELGTRLVELETGGVDLIYRVPLEHLEELERSEEIIVQKDPYASIRGLWFQQETFEPFAEVEVRRALAHGLNAREIHQAFLEGVAVLGNSVIPVESWAYYDTSGYEYDPEKAAEILEEAGWTLNEDGIREKDGQELKFTIMSPDGRYLMDKEICEAAMAQWEQIGVDVNVEVYEWGTFIDRLYATEFDMIFLGWMQSSFEPVAFTNTLVKTGGRAAWWDYSNLGLDAILTEAVAVPDLEVRKELYKEAQKIIHRDVVFIPLYNHLGMVAHTANLKGYEYTALQEDFTQAWIEE